MLSLSNAILSKFGLKIVPIIPDPPRPLIQAMADEMEREARVLDKYAPDWETYSWKHRIDWSTGAVLTAYDKILAESLPSDILSDLALSALMAASVAQTKAGLLPIAITPPKAPNEGVGAALLIASLLILFAVLVVSVQ